MTISKKIAKPKARRVPQKRTAQKKTKNRSPKLDKGTVAAQLKTLVEQEVDNILKSETVILAIDNQNFQIKDYFLEIKNDRAVCRHKKDVIGEFYTKQCAVLYILSEINKRYATSAELVRLDTQILNLKADKEIMTHQAKRILKTDRFKAEVLYHRLTEVDARLKKAVESVKKYHYLAKYQKGISV